MPRSSYETATKNLAAKLGVEATLEGEGDDTAVELWSYDVHKCFDPGAHTVFRHKRDEGSIAAMWRACYRDLQNIEDCAAECGCRHP